MTSDILQTRLRDGGQHLLDVSVLADHLGNVLVLNRGSGAQSSSCRVLPVEEVDSYDSDYSALLLCRRLLTTLLECGFAYKKLGTLRCLGRRESQVRILSPRPKFRPFSSLVHSEDPPRAKPLLSLEKCRCPTSLSHCGTPQAPFPPHNASIGRKFSLS